MLWFALPSARALSEDLGCPAALSHGGLIDAPSTSQTHTELANVMLQLLHEVYIYIVLPEGHWWCLKCVFILCVCVHVLGFYQCGWKWKTNHVLCEFFNRLGWKCPNPQIAAQCTGVQITAGPGVALFLLNPNAASQYSYSPGTGDYFFLWPVLWRMFFWGETLSSIQQTKMFLRLNSTAATGSY